MSHRTYHSMSSSARHDQTNQRNLGAGKPVRFRFKISFSTESVDLSHKASFNCEAIQMI